MKALGRLAQSPFPDAVRRCAVYSLRATHSGAALPTLLNLLDDSDADIRYDAVIGIASYAVGQGGSAADLKNYPAREAHQITRQ